MLDCGLIGGVKFVENVVGVRGFEDAEWWVNNLLGDYVNPFSKKASGVVDFFFVDKFDFELLFMFCGEKDWGQNQGFS